MIPTLDRLERTIEILRAADLPAVMSAAVHTDANGNLAPPANELVIVDLITETPIRASMRITRIDTILQVTCIGASPRQALELLEDARAALPFPEYDPGITGALGRVPATLALYAAFQRFTIHYSPSADAIGS
jgi:hypothetical protein